MSHPGFHLVFNLQSGQTGGFNPGARDEDLPFTQKDEPATLPRVAELVIITEHSPWCTIVKNDRGVTLGDICSTVWKEHNDNLVTEAEFNALPPRLQEHVKRSANASGGGGGWNMYYSPAPAQNQYRRTHWFREKVYFEGLVRKDTYTISRLGFKAPNIFCMQLTS
jgi:hypothetical protein